MAVNQPRTHSIAKMHFPGDHFSAGWWWHFAPFSSGLLEEENRMISKMLFFPVALEWWCSCKPVLCSRIPCLNVTVGGQMWLCFKGRSDNCDCDLYCLTLLRDEQIFYRNNSWGSQKPLSLQDSFLRTLSFGIRVARISCFLGERAKDIWILSDLERNLFPVISLHTVSAQHKQECSSAPLFVKLPQPSRISSLSLCCMFGFLDAAIWLQGVLWWWLFLKLCKRQHHLLLTTVILIA